MVTINIVQTRFSGEYRVTGPDAQVLAYGVDEAMKEAVSQAQYAGGEVTISDHLGVERCLPESVVNAMYKRMVSAS